MHALHYVSLSANVDDQTILCRRAVSLAERQDAQLKVAAQVSLGVALAIASREMPAEIPVSSRGAMLDEAAEALSEVASKGKANVLALYNLALLKASFSLFLDLQDQHIAIRII